MTDKEGSMIIKFSISEVSKVLFSLRYFIRNHKHHPKAAHNGMNSLYEWLKKDIIVSKLASFDFWETVIDDYDKLASDIEGMLKTYEENESAEREEESSEGSRATETSS